MDVLRFAGAYADDSGQEAIVWRVEESRRYRYPTFDVFTTIRGVDLQGGDFDAMEPVGRPAGALLPLDSAGELTDCILSGDLPCTVAAGPERRPAAITFSLDLRRLRERSPAAPRNLTLSLVLDGTVHAVSDDWFEDGILRLEQSMPAGTHLICCATCLFSDYSPAGHGLTGMRCHRGAKDRYLAVSSKRDYWSVPVTEEVPETYLCDEYERRIPGTGYRG
jgi:hypothetical protein